MKRFLPSNARFPTHRAHACSRHLPAGCVLITEAAGVHGAPGKHRQAVTEGQPRNLPQPRAGHPPLEVGPACASPGLIHACSDACNPPSSHRNESFLVAREVAQALGREMQAGSWREVSGLEVWFCGGDANLLWEEERTLLPHPCQRPPPRPRPPVPSLVIQSSISRRPICPPRHSP